MKNDIDMWGFFPVEKVQKVTEMEKISKVSVVQGLLRNRSSKF